MKPFSLSPCYPVADVPEAFAFDAPHPETTPPKKISPRSFATTAAMLLLIYPPTLIFADSLAEIQLMAPQDSLVATVNTFLPDSSATTGDTAHSESSPTVSNIENNELENIVLSTKNIRANGWGEYEVGGRCLCCDNMLDGDCIIVHNTNRTEKKRIKQIVDGKIQADTSDETTYFGDLAERERSEHVTTLMAEISLNKQRDIYKVIVHTLADKEKKSNFISNCELGYYDQFDRLQWAGKAQFEADDDRVIFELKKPIFTGTILIKTTGGKNRITEAAIFCKKSKQ